MQSNFVGTKLQSGNKHIRLLREISADTVGGLSVANKHSYTALRRRRP
jgi:hypothetical protein